MKAISSESAAQSLSAEKLDEYAPLMDEMTQRLDKDLRYLFSAQGIDESNYDKDVVRLKGWSSSPFAAHPGLQALLAVLTGKYC